MQQSYRPVRKISKLVTPHPQFGNLRKPAVPVVLLLACLSACAPNLGPRPQPITTASLASTRSLAFQAPAAAWPVERWWQAYGDPQLDALVAEALASSPDVAAALARIRAARGLAEATGAAALPQLNGNGSAGLNKQSRNLGIPPQFIPPGWRGVAEADIAGSFDLDLWGRNRAALAAATSDAEAAEVDARQATLLLAAAVVSNYGELARLEAEGDTLRAALAARATSTALTARRRAAGLDSDLPGAQARSAEDAARLDVARNAEQVAAIRHALAALLGAGPDRGLAIARPTLAPQTLTALPADAGIALAGRRPDIVAARLRVEALAHRTDAAERAFLPDVSLMGLIGFNSLGIANLFEANSNYGSAKAAVSLPIFDGGRRAGTLRQTRAGYDEAVARYDSTVVTALREVADAVSAREAAREQSAAASSSAAEAARAEQLARMRYGNGLTTYLEVLSAADRALAARRSAADAGWRLFALDVMLARTLGGGFAAAPGSTPKESPAAP